MTSVLRVIRPSSASVSNSKKVAAVSIQRAYRRWKRHIPFNEVDPITLEEITRPWFLVISGDSCVAYDPLSLRQYIEASHSTHDPVTRRPLNRAELHRLSRLSGGGEIRVNPDARANMALQTEMAHALERIASEQLASLRELAEHHVRSFRASLDRMRADLRNTLALCRRYDQFVYLSLISHSKHLIAASPCKEASRRELLQLLIPSNVPQPPSGA